MKRYLAILFLFFWSQLTYAQQQVTLLDKPSLYLTSNSDILTDRIQKTAAQNNGKTNDVYLAGGFISIVPADRKFGTAIRFSKVKRTADSISLNYYRTHNLYYKTYYEARETSNKRRDFYPIDSSKKMFSQNQKRIVAYLKVNDVFNIDITDYKTDTLVKRYSFKRIRIAPTISFYRLDGNKIISPIQPIENRLLSVAASDKIGLISKNNNDLRRQYINYTIINLKTGRQERYSDKNSIKLPDLMANTDYEIRCSYEIQPESISIYRIHVRAKWYQLPIVYGLAIGLLLLTIAFFVILRLRSKVSLSQKKQTEIEQSILRLQSQLNPHFTFNALSSIQGLMNTNRVAEANDYLQDFSTLLRKTLAKGQQIFNTLDQELEMMQTYIRLEALRYNFSWTIELAPEINPSTIEIPTLLLQPLVENAIKHGIASLGPKGKLQITCRASEADSLLISIKDNGQWIDNKTHSGYGLQLTNERISAINKWKKEKKIVLKFDKQNGTEANLLFYNWINN